MEPDRWGLRSRRAGSVALWQLIFWTAFLTTEARRHGARKNGETRAPRTIRFRAVFHPFIDRFSPFLPFSEKPTEDEPHAIAAPNAVKT